MTEESVAMIAVVKLSVMDVPPSFPSRKAGFLGVSNAVKLPVTTGGPLRLVCNKSELETGNGVVSLKFVMMTAACALDM